MKGRFITFEGLDGSGKSTHLRFAAEQLRARGRQVLTTKEPGGTPLGDAIRGLFLDPRWGEIDGRVEALLVFASRRQHLLEQVEPALARGVDVLCDRFTDSSIAYQGFGRDLGADWVRALDRLATDGRRPDLTLLFDLEPEAARARGQKHGRKDGAGPDRLDAESLAFYRRVREGFLAQAEREPERFRLVDTSGPLERARRRVVAVLESALPETELPETGPAETEPLETEPPETGPAETGPAETAPAETTRSGAASGTERGVR